MSSGIWPEPYDVPRILIVDDDPAFRRILARTLDDEAPRFCHRSVGTGTAALDFLREVVVSDPTSLPDGIVLDFRLPDMNAPAVLQALRRESSLEHIPVLVLTQAHWADDEAAAREAGARMFSQKPSSIHLLRALILAICTTPPR